MLNIIKLLERKRCFMALPLLLLGAASVSALVMQSFANDRDSMERKRKRRNKVETLAHLAKYDSPVAVYPSEVILNMTSEYVPKIKPKIGSVVCCGLGGILDHTGIYIGENTIVELAGNGLVRAISMERFLDNRSGELIFIACDSKGRPLTCKLAADQATKNVFNYYEYDVINNNCHRFIWQCFSQQDSQFSTFKAFSYKLAKYFNRVIYWDVCQH